MTLELRHYVDGDAEAWDAFCSEALQATFMHRRRFLSYHGERFVDRSLVIESGGRIVGVFPAADGSAQRAEVVSHPGITFGGLVHRGGLQGQLMLDALELICAHYRERGTARLVYKVVPSFYHRVPAEDDRYALFRLGARRFRCDLSSTIDLQRRLPLTERRRRSLKKAQAAGVEIRRGREYFAPLWRVLADNLAREHGAVPVHTLQEIELLADRFPQEIVCICAELDGDTVAGVVLFETHTAHHAQYIASSERGYAVSALDAVFAAAIDLAIARGRRWFDFGISNEEQGLVLNSGLYRFKSEFGGGGTVHEMYEILLKERP